MDLQIQLYLDRNRYLATIIDHCPSESNSGTSKRLSKDLGLGSILFATHAENLESDNERLIQATSKVSRYSQFIKSMLDIKETMIEDQPPTSAYIVSFKGSFLFEVDEIGSGKKTKEVSDVNVPQASYMWNFSIFDPRASAVPGSYVVIPNTYIHPWMDKAFYASPESMRGLPRFGVEILRTYPALGHLLHDQKVPFASDIRCAHLWLSGVLVDGISSFPTRTMPIYHEDGQDVKHARWPKFVQDIIDEVDIALARLSPTTVFYDSPRLLQDQLCKKIPRIPDGGCADILDIRFKGDGHGNSRREAFWLDSATDRLAQGYPSRRQNSPRTQGIRRYSTVNTSAVAAKRAFIALGSNMGDRLANIEAACHKLAANPDIALQRTSSLWETKAMYVTDQDDFLNGVCEIVTTLEPLILLDTLQAIENDLGRERLVEKGPRTLDLDILLYGSEAIDIDRLTVPHKLMLERHFVLKPLCELIPDTRLTARGGQGEQSFSQHLERLGAASVEMSTMTSLASGVEPLRPLIPSRRTQVMSILNVTPDSFSDGGRHKSSDIAYLTETIRSHLAAGATILDIGGQSSRPKAAPVSADEEIERVLPAIKAARAIIDNYEYPYKAAISIDTYRSDVARAAVENGADIINDVSGGTLDSDMLSTMASLGCTVILMHMRGTPHTMTSKENTTYDGDLIQVIREELLERVRAAEEAGVRRWRLVLDPGIGFAKTADQNLELLRRFTELRNFPGLKGLPWLIGASRKGFVGKITGVKQADERTWGTAATVAASVQGGAHIVRVHDVDEMVKVVKMSDAIWRV